MSRPLLGAYMLVYGWAFILVTAAHRYPAWGFVFGYVSALLTCGAAYLLNRQRPVPQN